MENNKNNNKEILVPLYEKRTYLKASEEKLTEIFNKCKCVKIVTASSFFGNGEEKKWLFETEDNKYITIKFNSWINETTYAIGTSYQIQVLPVTSKKFNKTYNQFVVVGKWENK